MNKSITQATQNDKQILKSIKRFFTSFHVFSLVKSSNVFWFPYAYTGMVRWKYFPPCQQYSSFFREKEESLDINVECYPRRKKLVLC